MRCRACNALLNDQEATRKAVNTGDYIELCNHCFSTISDEVAYVDGNGSNLNMDDLDDDDQQGRCTEDCWESDMQSLRGDFPAFGVVEE